MFVLSFGLESASIWAGKRGYGLVHDPYVLKRCNISPMLDFVNCQIGKYGKFRNFFLKCVNVGNMNAVYYEGLHLSMKCGLEEGIQVLEANVPNHGMSTLALGIFNVCLGKDIEASQIFQEFEVKHADLRSEALIGMGDQLEFQLSLFDAPYLNSYASTFKYPDDDVIQSPVCIYNHDYTIESKGYCINCSLFRLCCKICEML